MTDKSEVNSDNREIQKYKHIFQKVNELDEILLKYIKSVITSSYDTAIFNIESILDSYINNRKEVVVANKRLVEYSKIQSECIEKSVKVIDSCKFENINLFQAFDQIKRNLIDKKHKYDNISNSSYTLDFGDDVKDFLKNSVRYYEMKFSSNEKKYADECYEVLRSQDYNGLVKIISLINDDVKEVDFDNFYNLYSVTVKDLDKSFLALKIEDYSTFVLEDRKSLNEIIDLLSNFELSFVKHSDSDTENIKNVSKSILDIYNKTYDEFIIIKNNEKVEINKVRVMPSLTFEKTIEKKSIELISNEKTFLQFSAFMENVINKISEIKELVTKIMIENTNYKVDYEVFELCSKINKEFYKIVAFCDETNSEYVLKKSHDIINGIQETISIKCENINSEENTLKEEFINNCVYVKDEIFDNIKIELLKNDIDDITKVENVSKLFNKDYETEVFAMKQNASFNEELENFKRNSILKELSTFEQIMSDSVKSLKDDENQKIKDFVSFMEKSNEYLEKTLNEFGIFIISPEEKSKFDSKEQQILLAEKKDGYKKGEIIKVINSGYKEKDEVVLKANVVCSV